MTALRGGGVRRRAAADRALRAKPEKIQRAILNADATAKWTPPCGFTCKVHHVGARANGAFRMSFENFSIGNRHSFGDIHLEPVPGGLIRDTDKFDDPSLPGEMQVTVPIRHVSCGSEVAIVQEDVPDVIPLEMCCRGWEESLAQLTSLVEPDIPG